MKRSYWFASHGGGRRFKSGPAHTDFNYFLSEILSKKSIKFTPDLRPKSEWKGDEIYLLNRINNIRKSREIRDSDKRIIIRKILPILFIRGYSLSTISRYIEMYYRMARMSLSNPLSKMKEPDIDVINIYLARKSQSTVAKYKAAINLLRQEINPNIPELKVKGIKTTKDYVILSDEEIKNMLDFVKRRYPKYYNYIALLADVGARPIELKRLRKQDVIKKDDFYVLILRGKGKKRVVRTINFSGVLDLSKEYIFEDITRDGLRKVFKRISDLLGKNVTPYDLRHTAATRMAKILGNEFFLRQWFGWEFNSPMPRVYIHLNSQNVLEAIAEKLKDK